MSAISVTVDARAFEAFAARLPADVARALAAVIAKATVLIARGAKQNAPVDTGRLRASIASTTHPINGEVRTHVDYAEYVHNGTRFVHPRPFLYDAATQVERQLDSIIDGEMAALG